MNSLKIILLLITILIICLVILFFINKQKLVREETPDGYKIGDDSYTCLCKCSRKCNSTSNSTPTPDPNSPQISSSSLGYRINTYPWFIKTR